MKRSFVLLFTLTVGVYLNAGTKSQPLELIKFKKINRPANYSIQKYSPYVNLKLTLKNNTEETITAWKSLMKVRNAFNEEILTIMLTSGDSQIKPGMTENADFIWEDNQFIDDEPYDRLATTSSENLKIDISETKVVTKP